jgi:hypothetical protein
MWLREQSFKCGDTALKQMQELAFSFFLPEIIDLTCNRSSKSRAASFFISDAFVAKRRMLEPNVGMSRKLVTAKRLLFLDKSA